MTGGLKLFVLERAIARHELALDTPLEVGRQRTGEVGPYELVAPCGSTPARLIIAANGEKNNISRQHLLLEPLPTGRVRVVNQNKKLPLVCPEAGSPILPGGSVELDPPFSLSLPPRTLVVELAESIADDGLEGLELSSVAPSGFAMLSTAFRSPPPISPDMAHELISWLHGTLTVLQAAIGAADFLDQAACALLQIVGLDSGRVLLLDGTEWKVCAARGPGISSSEWRPSRHVLDLLRRDKRTFLRQPSQPRSALSPSLMHQNTVVAAPILNTENQVVGALYGERYNDGPSQRGAVSKLEAMLVDVLALGVATRLARQNRETAVHSAGNPNG